MINDIHEAYSGEMKSYTKFAEALSNWASSKDLVIPEEVAHKAPTPIASLTTAASFLRVQTAFAQHPWIVEYPATSRPTAVEIAACLNQGKVIIIRGFAKTFDMDPSKFGYSHLASSGNCK